VEREDAMDDITARLRSIRGLRPGAVNNFAVVGQDKLMAAFNGFTGNFFMIMIALASVGLLVGGVGVVAIMMISVTERTREIGVRVAVGASEAAIRLQFLGESVMLSLVGGAVGVLLGIIGTVVAGRALDWPMKLSPQAVLVAALFSVAVGVFFGYYPARKASLLDPIEALRTE